ncbi:MAG: DUF924 family protein [Myxococcota bacterium]
MADPNQLAILDYWFSGELRSDLWFHPSAEDDAEIRTRFGRDYEVAAAGGYDDWARDARGALALVLLLDQFPRHMFRGTARMFESDARARPFAERALAAAADLDPVEQAFAWMCLEHAEDAAIVTRSVAGFDALCRDPCTRGARRFYKGLRRAARQHHDILLRYGRYPHRNEVLGRQSTPEELAWLAQKNKPRFAVSVQPSTELAPLKVLVLHSFRQSGARLASRTKALQAALASVAELVFVDAPHPYTATDRTRSELTNDFGPDLEDLGDETHQRCWWNSGADHTRYDGWDASVAYLTRVAKERGPFDGVLGFSQGAAAAGLLAAAHRELAPRFAICISGFASRANEHRELMRAGTIDVPSLHIYGEQDVLVDNARTLALAECFVAPKVVAHPGGHFVPKLWPVAAIRDFLVAHARPAATCALEERVRFARLHRRPIGLSEAGRAVWDRLHSDEPDAALVAAASVADLQVMLWALQRDYRSGRSENVMAPLPGDEFYRLFLCALEHAPDHFVDYVHEIPRIGSWALLTRLAIYAHAAPQTDATSAVHREIVRAFVDRLSLEHRADGPVSACGVAAPRTQSATQRACGLAGDIATQMFPRRSRTDAYVAYTRVIAGLSKRYHQAHANVPTLRAQRRQQALVWRDAADTPVSEDVLRPRPVPVQPCALDELEPLLDHLRDKRPVESQTSFVRGTHMPDGRLDLCKQVVGPDGIGPVLDGLADNPHVSHFMIGNNIVGNVGATAIADFIRSGRSHVDVWYIGGNEIDAEGLAPICEALIDNPHVESLWLKRNPLGRESGPMLAELLRRNDRIHTLDLVNTGLLDEGVAPIIEALHDNRGVRHLYLGTNGLGPASAQMLAELLAKHDRLQSLLVSCNRLGDDGAAYLAGGLTRNRSLLRLGLASNRLSPDAATRLAEAVRPHPTLRFLDLGWTRATAAVGELGNRIGDEGARALADMLRDNRVLQGLDLSHNRISQSGLDAIAEALERNDALAHLRHPQHGKAVNHDSIAKLHARLDANWARFAGTEAGQASDREDITTPRSTREILSVYRTAYAGPHRVF